MGMPKVGSGDGRPEFVLERRVTGNGALGDLGDSVHEGGLLLGLTSPVNGDAGTWDAVDHVDDQDVILTYLNSRSGWSVVVGRVVVGNKVWTGRRGAIGGVRRAIRTRAGMKFY